MKIFPVILTLLVVCSCSKAPSRFCIGSESSSYVGNDGSKLNISWNSADQASAKFSFSAPLSPPLSNEIIVPISRDREYIIISNILSIPLGRSDINWAVNGMNCSMLSVNSGNYFNISCENASYGSKTSVTYSRLRGILSWNNFEIERADGAGGSKFNLVSKHGFGYADENGSCA